MLRLTGFIILVLLLSCNTSRVAEKKEEGWAKKIINPPVPNLFKINDSMYRSAQPGKNSITYFDSLGIRSILNLRKHHEDPVGIHAKAYAVKMKASRFTDDDIIRALQIISTAPKPILVHCRYGADRTGLVIAMYRIIFENWTREKAIAELLNGGYGFHTRYENIPEYIQHADITAIKKSVLAKN
jgi:tyrosine-protein phosphatase SIW14